MSSESPCPKCKAKVKAGTKFCPYCMVKLEVAREPEPEIVAPVELPPAYQAPARREGTGQEDLLAEAGRILGGIPEVVTMQGSVLQGYALWTRPDHLVLLTLGFSELGRTPDVWPESGRGFELLLRVDGSVVPRWLFNALDGLLQHTFKTKAGTPLRLLPTLWCETVDVEGLERFDSVNGVVRVVEVVSPFGNHFRADDNELLPRVPPDDETRRMQIVWTFDQDGETSEYTLCGNTVVLDGTPVRCLSRAQALERLRDGFEDALATSTRMSRSVRERPPRRALAAYSPLEEEFLRARDDEKAARVFRDWLLERGDPRGELAAWIDGGSREELAFFWQHDAEVLLEDWARQIPHDAFTWKCGFLDSCLITHRHAGSYSDQLRMILELRFLSTARGFRFMQPDQDDLSATWKAIASAPQAARMQTLSLNEDSTQLSWTNGHDLGPLLKAMPALKELRIEATRGALGRLEHPGLRALTIAATDLSPQRVKELTDAKLPSLQSLDVWTGRGRADRIEELFQRRGLLSFGLMNCGVTQEALPHLVRSPLFETLKALSFAGGALIDDDVPAIVALAPSLRKLERFDVSDNTLSADALRTLRRALPNLISKSQREAYDEGERYVSVAE